jgi:hypothetical protein
MVDESATSECQIPADNSPHAPDGFEGGELLGYCQLRIVPMMTDVIG